MATISIVTTLKRSYTNYNTKLFALNAAKCHRYLTVHSDEIPRAATTKQFKLSFTDYQKLKRSLKTKQRLAGVPFAFTGMFISSMATAYLFPDMFDATPENVQLIMGMDPLVFCGISGVAASGLCYIAGTNIYKVLWNVMNKEEGSNLYARDIDFLKRLEQYRFQGDSKFEDDYYGESIKTLSDYRQWVRTQQKKKETSQKFKLNQNEQQ